MQKMIEEREREIRMRVERAGPWLSERRRPVGDGKSGMRRAIGRALLAWGSALLEG
jgi:hypothetical protein